MSGRIVSSDVPCLERLPSLHENECVDVKGYEADEEESDHYDSDSSSAKVDKSQSPISKADLTPKRRRRKRFTPSLVGLLSSINPSFDERISAQFITVIRSYCDKQAEYLQLHRNFIAARCCIDDNE
jgi:hypothetical protein